MQINRVPSVADVENRLIKLGYERRNIATMIAGIAEIDETTWRRWRNGENEPTLSAWQRVVEQVIRIRPKQKGRKRNGRVERNASRVERRRNRKAEARS